MKSCKGYRLIHFILILAPGSALATDDTGKSSDPILITDVRPWNGSDVAGEPISVLVADGRIAVVDSSPIETVPETISVDGGKRIIMGRIAVGEPANLLIVDGNPADDITILAEPSSAFLVVREGSINPSRSASMAADQPGVSSEYRAVDPNRFKVVTLPEKPWYVHDNERFSVAFGGGVLLDRTEFNQDGDSKDQLGSLKEFDNGEIRAVRFGVGGHLRLLDQPWKYTIVGANRAFDQGFNTDNSEEWEWYDWAIGVPVYGGAELKVGKQKENLSHDRTTLLVDQQFMERAMVLDAMLPSRNTGVTLANDALDGRMTWSVGAFFDMFGDRDEPFEESNQYAVRVSGLPFISDDNDRLLHVGIGYRYSDVDSGVLRFKVGPESYFPPDFVDTGEFAASDAAWLSLEVGWRQGPVWLMSEYLGTQVDSSQVDDPDFEGFHFTGAWALTGEIRPYNQRKGVFGKLIPARDVNHGGAGAWEAVARYSEVDLTDGLIEGGDMSRMSVGMNWYATSSFKATAQYGWVDLDRFGISSTTGLFQLRMAFLLGL